MNSRHPRHAGAPKRAPVAPIHRGPQSQSHPVGGVTPPFHHAPNAALLIDFDNVTMGIRSDLGHELRNLLSSDIIKGKVAVQRAYADWRRYPQYIVPLSEASIDLIFAPAYGSSKKNATDIRLAIDAIELVFARPEIGTFILLSGDSDFSSLVIKLKEYGKYVIGVGIRESSSDLLVQNCDEYYSYNALAGLVRTNEDEPAKRDPWELVSEAIQRMQRNGDVMRSDRLKQVMQEIDGTFDEKDLGMSKFSKFCQEAAQRGLISISRLENGQLEVGTPGASPPAEPGRRPVDTPRVGVPAVADVAGAEPPVERARRGRGRGRGRGRDGAPRREDAASEEAAHPMLVPAELLAPEPRADAGPAPRAETRPESRPEARPEPRRPVADDIGLSGERLTREEAFDLVRRAVAALTTGEEDAARASDVRRRARALLGRDSESLSERNFTRILRDAHDADVIDLRRRGDDFEVSRAAAAESVAEQLKKAEPPPAPAAPSAPATMRRAGMGPRRLGGRGRGGPAEPPPDLLTVGVVDEAPVVRPPVAAPAPVMPEPAAPVFEAPEVATAAAGKTAGKRGGSRRGKKAPAGSAASPAAKKGRGAAKKSAPAAAEAAPAGDGARKPRRPRARKPAAAGSEE